MSNSTIRTITRHRATRAALGMAAIVVLLTSCISADQQSDMDLINAKRANARLGALTLDMAAASKAQGWSQHMASTGVLEHSGGGTKITTTGLTKWCTVGENVGYGRSVELVHNAFMASAAHKANILGGYHRVGTGVVKKGSVYWVTEIFIKNC